MCPGRASHCRSGQFPHQVDFFLMDEVVAFGRSLTSLSLDRSRNSSLKENTSNERRWKMRIVPVLSKHCGKTALGQSVTIRSQKQWIAHPSPLALYTRLLFCIEPVCTGSAFLRFSPRPLQRFIKALISN